MCKFCKQRTANTFVNLDLFYSYHDCFLQNYTIKSMKCQHNPYLESIRTRIIAENYREIPKSIGKFWSIIDSSLRMNIIFIDENFDLWYLVLVKGTTHFCRTSELSINAKDEDMYNYYK